MISSKPLALFWCSVSGDDFTGGFSGSEQHFRQLKTHRGQPKEHRGLLFSSHSRWIQTFTCLHPGHLRLNLLRLTWGLQARPRIHLRRPGSSILTSRCVKSTHPSQNSSLVFFSSPGSTLLPEHQHHRAPPHQWGRFKFKRLSPVCRTGQLQEAAGASFPFPLLHLLWMSRWNPTPPVLRRNSQASEEKNKPPIYELHLKRREQGLEKCDPSELRLPGGEVFVYCCFLHQNKK